MTFAFAFDIGRGVLSPAGSAQALDSLTIRRNSVNTFVVYLWQNGAPIALPAGHTLEASAKATPDGESLLAFGEWSGTQPISTTVHAASVPLASLLGADANPDNDTDANVFMDFALLNNSGQVVAQSQRIALTVENTITHGGESGPELMQVSARLIENLYSVTGLTGGGSTKLDGRATLTLPEKWRVMLNSGGAAFFYELRYGTNAENAPDVVLPDDYNASTNAKYWQRLLIGSDTPGGWGAIIGDIDGQSDLNALFARLASPAFTGNPTAPTQALGNSSTRIASTAFVAAAILSALDDDPDFAANVLSALAGKVSTSRTLNVTGLVTGGGDLTANRTFSVTPASQSLAEAGTSNTVAITPQSFTQALAKLGLLNPGYFTAYTGGGAGKLDGIVTAGRLSLGHCIDTAIGGDSARWQLQAWDGVEAENASEGRVLPNDAHAVTNPVIWVRI